MDEKTSGGESRRVETVLLTVESLADDYRRLGIGTGDTVMIRADVARIVARPEEAPRIVEGLLKAVGPAGTIICPAFTRMFLLSRLDAHYIFDADTPPVAGALARLFLKHPGCIRSRHPVNSIAAIGARAEDICRRHDETAPSYLFIQDLLDLHGKLVVAGCVDTNPGFTTVHWAQYTLGLAQQSFLSNRMGVYYRKDGQVRLFRRSDPGGHSLGSWRFYAHYVCAGKLFTGRVGHASAIAIEARDAYAIERELLQADPRYGLCGPECFACSCTWKYNLRGIPRFLLHKALVKLHLVRPGRQKVSAATGDSRPTGPLPARMGSWNRRG